MGNTVKTGLQNDCSFETIYYVDGYRLIVSWLLQFLYN